MYHITESEISLITHGNHVGGIELGTLMSTMKHEGTTLTDKSGTMVLLFSIFWQLFVRDKPGIIPARPRNYAHTVCSEKYRSAVFRSMG